MTDMKRSPRYRFLLGLALIAFTASCSSMKTLHVWKDEKFNQRLQKVLIIAIAEQDYMRNHFENVLAESLAAQGIDAVPSNKVLPDIGDKPDREALVAKVKELGFRNVLVSRSVNKKEVSDFQPGGIMFASSEFYGGWYGFYSSSYVIVATPGREYDADYYSLVTNIFEVSNEKLVWSNLSQVKVEGSKEGAINPFIEFLMKQLADSKLI
jgi:hypothetical protein